MGDKEAEGGGLLLNARGVDWNKAGVGEEGLGLSGLAGFRMKTYLDSWFCFQC